MKMPGIWSRYALLTFWVVKNEIFLKCGFNPSDQPNLIRCRLIMCRRCNNCMSWQVPNMYHFTILSSCQPSTGPCNMMLNFNYIYIILVLFRNKSGSINDYLFRSTSPLYNTLSLNCFPNWTFISRQEGLNLIYSTEWRPDDLFRFPQLLDCGHGEEWEATSWLVNLESPIIHLHHWGKV